jgi:FKBP-type peptidyl-prolyl cis-trans isomerase FklB
MLKFGGTVLAAMACGVILMTGGQAWAADEAAKKAQAPQMTDKEKLSYTLGVNTGKNIKQQAIDIDPDQFSKGMKDALSGAKPALTDEEMLQSIMALQKDMQEKQAAKMKGLAEENKKKGEAFLAENKNKEGVKTLPSGLQYKIIKNGKGKSPKITDTVTANYKGTSIDGTEFDSSYKRGEPAKFPLKGVIPGWIEALKMMKVGSQWQIFVPANLGYGERGASPVIGPNETLIFEIELLKIGSK